jgi:hypothetical protein
VLTEIHSQENFSNDVWDYTIRDMFLPTKASSDKITSSSRCAKKNTSHRLLTSTDVLKEKQASIEKKETAELKKKERLEKLFNSVYLFCLFVCTLSIALLTCDFLDLIISSGLLLRYSFADVLEKLKARRTKVQNV